MGISYKQLTIVGCTTLAISALGYLLYWSKSKPKSNLDKKIILSQESFIEICQNIRNQYSSHYWQAVKECRVERRKYSPKSKHYEKAIENFQSKTKIFLDNATEQVLRKYRIDHKIFECSVNYYDSFEEIRQYAEEIVKPAYSEEIESKLTIDEVRDFMVFYLSRLNELKVDYLDFDEYYIVKSRIEDEIYKKYGIEVEELDDGYKKYKEELEEVVEPLKEQTSYFLASVNDDSFEERRYN